MTADQLLMTAYRDNQLNMDGDGSHFWEEIHRTIDDHSKRFMDDVFVRGDICRRDFFSRLEAYSHN
jgi:hypothetical protein